jgi:hypothetical protein
MTELKAGVTRRGLAIALASAIPAAAAQQGAAAKDLDATARDDVNQARQRLRSIRVPIATEPSCIFRP